jgi:phage shock protein A
MSDLEIRSQLIELKRLLAGAMADEQRLYQRSAEAERESDRWKKRAELALSRGSEELARAALERSGREGARAEQYRRDYLEQRQYVQDMKRRLVELEGRARRQPVPSGELRGVGDLERSLVQLRRQEDRGREQRAALAAWAELERDELAEKLAVLEREDQLERQLAELKARLGR